MIIGVLTENMAIHFYDISRFSNPQFSLKSINFGLINTYPDPIVKLLTSCYKIHPTPITDLLFYPQDQNILVFGSEDGSIKILQFTQNFLKKKTLKHHKCLHHSPVLQISFSENGAYMASVSSNRTVFILNCDTNWTLWRQIEDLIDYSPISISLSAFGRYLGMLDVKTGGVDIYDI